MSFAERFPTLARHWMVLRSAWIRQDQADADRKPQSDHEFLPAALEIMETPPSPGLRMVMLGLCGMFALALLWAFIGKVDVVAVASGKTLPTASVKIIQPIEIGAIRAIHVRNGQRVKKGQLLIELDPTIASADQAQAGRGLMSAEIAKARNAALLAYLRGRDGRFAAPEGTPEEVATTQAQFVRSSIAEFEAERASLVQARAEQLANLAASAAEVAKLRETLPLMDQQLTARQELSEKGYFSKLKALEYQQLRVEHVRNIDIQEANVARARAAIANIEAQIAKLSANFARSSAGELATAQDDASVRGEELVKSDRRKAFQTIRAPVDGVVQQLAVTTIGGIVQPAQALMVIVPEGSGIEVEAFVLNKDIGFVREGQPVRVKLEAFPFTDYGLIEGTVETISRDAIERDLPQYQGASPSRVSQQESRMTAPGLVYAARIRLSRTTIRVAGRDQPISPGMAVQAEIKTGERRIIDFLLSPISKAMDEAGRER